MLDDRIIPIGDIDRSVGPHLDVDGAECGMARLDQLSLLLGGEAGTVLAQDEAADPMAAEIVGDDVAAPGLGQMPATEDLAAAVFRTARVEAVEHARGAHRRRVARPRHDIVDALAARPVGDERLSVAVEVVAPGIDPAAGEDLQLARPRPKLPDSPTTQATDSVRGFDVAVNI